MEPTTLPNRFMNPLWAMPTLCVLVRRQYLLLDNARMSTGWLVTMLTGVPSRDSWPATACSSAGPTPRPW